VTVGVGHGKKGARNIDAWLRGGAYEPPPKNESRPTNPSTPGTTRTAPRSVQPPFEVARRRSNFDEMSGGLDESNALYEARHCLSCGTRFSCDNCYGVCPDNAVIKPGEPGEGYEIDYDFCKGCGICVSVCPSGAIQMVPERI
jgi:2-oxoacid:acceptor oxidoreductase delta subunit (pyruvate/2-ketoisovalerate family)